MYSNGSKRMFISENTFNDIFESTFWKKLNDSLVPFETKPPKKEFLASLYHKIANYEYVPGCPREYIVCNKYAGVSRFIPTFTYEDYCLYFMCVKLLEDEVAINRIEGTFGGWSLGNPLRRKEDEELLEYEYIPYNTLNPFAWAERWKRFQNLARSLSEASGYTCFLQIDIACFYDTINLTILEQRIRHVVPLQKQEIVTLLFHFLKNWNKRFEGYGPKYIGLPQDEIGDCSRLLANFYLQEYDKTLHDLCSDLGCEYIRYADDQIFASNDPTALKTLLFEASKELFKINLSLNSGKVRVFETNDEFRKYWAFEIFDLLSDPNDPESINKGIELFFKWSSSDVVFRKDSVLKRILSLDADLIESSYRHRLASLFLDQDTLASLSVWHLKRIRKLCINDTLFFESLDNLIGIVPHNAFHYNLLKYYSKERQSFDLTILHERIKALKF